MAAVAALLLTKLFQKLSKLTKQIQDQNNQIGVLNRQIGEQDNQISVLSKELGDQGNKTGVLGKALGDLKDETGVHDKALGDLKEETGVLAVALDELKQNSGIIAKSTIQQLIKFDKSSATIRFDGIESFLSSDETETSEFHCSGLSWILTLTTTYVKGSGEQLSVFLNHNNTDFLGHFSDWSADVTFDLKLLRSSRAEANSDIKKTASHVFKKGEESGFEEWTQFVSVESLKQYYIMGDAIEFEVEFQSLKFE